MTSYEARRLQNIQRNAALIEDLGLKNHDPAPNPQRPKQPPAKRRKLETGQPTRISARIASSSRPTYNEDTLSTKPERTTRRKAGPKASSSRVGASVKSESPDQSSTAHKDLDSIRAGWTSWVPVASPPTRDASGVCHFDSHPDFTPNKSPEEIIREGCFGGSYWRPLKSRYLKTMIEDDWEELPPEWTDGLDVEQYLTNPDYNPEVNKYGVACGQSIEEWEAAGWINHQYDVRGWFQWYCRFWMGRRCDDDERQVSRWKKCVGETGRWRRILLKKYVQQGIRSVIDEGDDDEDRGDVSPVVHQTCHHWAYEVRQEALDRFWAEGR